MSEVTRGNKCCIAICLLCILLSLITDPIGLVFSVPGLVLLLIYHFSTSRRNSPPTSSNSFNRNRSL